MATLRVNYYFWHYPFTTSNANQPLVFGASSSSTSIIDRLDIYQGTIEDWATFTNASTRSSDLLVSFTLNPSSSFTVSTTSNTTSYRVQLGITPNEATATQTGTATWFLLRNYYSSSNDLTQRGALMGNIGLTGSGADLEIPDTSILNGSNYRSSSFYINFPFEMTF